MQDNAFTPRGQTVLVDTNGWYQVQTSDNVASTSYRIRNVTASAAYIAWFPAQTTPPSASAPSAPTAGVPGSSVIGMVATSVEVFCLPKNAWFRASSAATFEITPGEGI